MILKVDNVSKNYGKTVAVENLSFETDKSEILGIIGPNGSGKTTIMRIITGLIKNFEGDVFINGSSVRENRDRRIGCIIEMPGFYPYLSGLENLKYFSMHSSIVDEKVFHEYIDLLGLSKAIRKKVSTYSMGMKQRLGILQSLINKPQLLILDEPTNGLDPNGIQEFREYIRKLAKEKNISVLISSHILSEIEQICDKVVILQNGRKLKEITLNENSRIKRCVYVLNTDQAEKLADFLREERLQVEEAGRDHIKVNMGGRDIGEVLAKIYTAGIKLTGITQDFGSLESEYLDLTGGNRVE
ncbi:MAG TPA: ABC transporter ATP-binding protein [Clostridiaceae bacterium]|nr:ABC transporter ATP-binding protein [Clostridiaceae bacterium]